MGRVRRLVSGCVAFAALLVTLSETMLSQQSDTSVVILNSGVAGPYRETADGFRKYLREHRPNAAVATYTLSEEDRGQVLDTLRRTPPSVLLTIGSPATTFSLGALEGVPIVGALLVDMTPVTEASNATGVALEFPPETSLTWLRRILPEYKTVGILYDPAQNQRVVDAAAAAAAELDLRLLGEGVNTPRDLRLALEQLARRADVLLGISDSTVLSPQTAQQVLLSSYRQQIPFVGLSVGWVKAGAIYALDRDYADVGAQCGELAVQILRGTAPHALPPQTPRKVLYDVNLKAAQHLKIALPADVIAGAREVIQ